MLFTLLYGLLNVTICADSDDLFLEQDLQACFTDPTNKEIDYKIEEEFANKIKEILSSNSLLAQFTTNLDKIYKETRNFLILKNVSEKFTDIFIHKNKREIIYFAIQFKYFVTFITKNFDKNLSSVIYYKDPRLNYKEYFYLSNYFMEIMFFTKTPFYDKKTDSYPFYYEYSLFLMKNRLMNLIYVFYKYHNLLLEIYKNPIVTSEILLFYVAYDMFLSRCILHMLDVMMLYVENESFMDQVAEVFCFNWTATEFYNSIIREKLQNHAIYNLSCFGKFSFPISNRSAEYFKTVYDQWNELTVKIPVKIYRTTLINFYSKNKHLGTILETKTMMEYKSRVDEKFNSQRTEGEGASTSTAQRREVENQESEREQPISEGERKKEEEGEPSSKKQKISYTIASKDSSEDKDKTNE
ncbi:hypothetical protein EHP00_2703 [Ecytonucleospora hepatopenaei]|uniref:Uncharacterized protein n=1 Tax=Ecytonucleospora hepatopenaei TaxID=646526 RepID=A0A1W0E650_9MICR|nr:hypothetical protein EHP00_773 [Ecytonucleospora hepatopenaei]OQS55312.1 hypothetical protein EHP00_2703 [Ecytonucleospora hepatopenaei]